MNSKIIITSLVLLSITAFISLHNAQSATPRYDGTIGMISIGLDHGFNSQLEPAQYMISKGVTGTVYVVTNRDNNQNFMPWSELSTLYNDGFEMASHSRSHLIESKLSLPQLYSEINGSKTDLANHSMNVCGFVPPSSSINKTTTQIIKGNYQYTMMSNGIAKGTFKVGPLNTLSTISGSTKNFGIPILIAMTVGNMDQNNLGNLKNFSAIKTQIDNAISSKSLIIIHFHDILPDNQTSFFGTQIPTSNSLFDQTIDYIKEQQDSGNLTISTQSEALGLGC